MMKTRRLQIKKLYLSDAILYLYIFSIILTQSTMYGVLYNFQQQGIDSFTFRVISFVVGVMCVITLSFLKGIKLSKNNVSKIFILLLYLLIYGVINIVRIKAYLEGLFIPFFIACIIIGFYENKYIFERFFSIYCRIVVFLAFISLVFYIFGTILHIIPGISMMYTNNGWWYDGTNYYYLSFINNWQTITIGGVTIVRNIGIFMEAPGYATILLYAFWWELFGKDKINKKNITILLVTIFTTFSSKAYIVSVIIIIMYLYSGQITLDKQWKKIRIVLLPILACLVVFISLQIIYTRNISVNDGNSSFTIRMSDYLAAFRAWKDYPLFGCGFYNLDKLYTYYPLIRKSGTSTAGILNILAYGGIYMAIFYIVSFIRYLKWNILYNKNKYRILSFVVLMLLLLITGNEQYSYVMLFFIAFGYMLNTKTQGLD